MKADLHNDFLAKNSALLPEWKFDSCVNCLVKLDNFNFISVAYFNQFESQPMAVILRSILKAKCQQGLSTEI
jgi:hypothetical protein